MKLKEFVNINVNRANNQVSFNLRSKQLKKAGLTKEQLLDLSIKEPKVNFKKILKKEVSIWNKKNKI